jgi:hypothetical protein
MSQLMQPGALGAGVIEQGIFLNLNQIAQVIEHSTQNQTQKDAFV